MAAQTPGKSSHFRLHEHLRRAEVSYLAAAPTVQMRVWTSIQAASFNPLRTERDFHAAASTRNARLRCADHLMDALHEAERIMLQQAECTAGSPDVRRVWASIRDLLNELAINIGGKRSLGSLVFALPVSVAESSNALLVQAAAMAERVLGGSGSTDLERDDINTVVNVTTSYEQAFAQAWRAGETDPQASERIRTLRHLAGHSFAAGHALFLEALFAQAGGNIRW